MTDFITENFPAPIANVRRAQAAMEFLKAAGAGKKGGAVLLFTDEYDTPLVYKSLAYQMKDSVGFGEADVKALREWVEGLGKDKAKCLEAARKGKRSAARK
eukprot:evm.model.NODE_14991_length_12132_cov_27.312727.1